MKRLLPVFVLSIFCFHQAFGQMPALDSFAIRINKIFQYVEKNRPASGLLKDYGLEIVDLATFGGTSLVDSNYAFPTHWFNLYKTVMSCKINSSGPAFKDPATIMNDADSVMTLGTIPINFLFYKYNKYRNDAYSAGLVTVTNNQIHDKYNSGVWVDPYELKYTFGATQMATHTKSKSVKFKYSGATLFSNIPSGVTYAADFGNGAGWTTLTSGTTYTINYADTGLKEVKYRAIYSGVTYLSHSKIYINDLVQNGTSTNKSVFAHATVTFPAVQYAHGGAQVQIRYRANHNGKIIKPLLILEDLDPYGWEHVNNTTLDNFWAPLNQGAYGAGLRNLINSEYDIVYVDWGNGCDYMEYNARVFQSVFAWLRDQLTASGSTEKIVTLGIGMGGIIARYQYKLWENQGVDIQNRLFISYDVPHQGLNISLGVVAHAQYLLNKRVSLGFGSSVLLSDEPAMKAANAINTGAVKQLAKYHLRYQDQSPYDLVMDNTRHDQFYTMLANLGYPATCRNIAIANGSQCGTANPLAEGTELYRFSSHANTRIVGDLWYTVSPVSWVEAAWDLVLNFSLNGLIRFIPGKSSIFFQYKVNGAKTNVANQVFYTKTWWVKKMFWLVNVHINLDEESYTTPSNITAFENYPGSQVDFSGIVDYMRASSSLPYYPNPSVFGNVINALTETFHVQGVDDWGVTYPGTSCYVPTTSALDIGLGTTALSTGDYYVKYSAFTPPTGTKQTPFANFITAFNGQRQNEMHGGMTVYEGNWLVNELKGTPQVIGCPAICGLILSGNTTVCTSQTFSLQDLGGLNATWTASPSGIVTLTPSADKSSAVVTRIGSNAGVVNITITFSGGCPAIAPISFNILVGAPVPDGICGPNQNLCYTRGNGSTGDFKVCTPVAGVTYSWQIDGDPAGSGTSITVNALQHGVGTHQISVRSSACGQFSTYKSGTFIVEDCGDGAVMVYPNPSPGEITLEADPAPVSSEPVVEQSASERASERRANPVRSQHENRIKIYEVQVLTMNGKLVYHKSYKEGFTKMNISLQHLPVGVYFVRTFNGKKWSNKKLVLSR